MVGLIGLLCRQQVVSFRVCLSELYFAVSVGENTVHRIPYNRVTAPRSRMKVRGWKLELLANI